MKKINLIKVFLTALLTTSMFSQTSDVMLQGFNWVSWKNTSGWYNVVNTKAVELQNAGIDAIWLPPPSKTADNPGYIPTVWYDLNSKYGTQAQLVSLINNLHTKNIKVLADIVINHRGGTTGFYDFSTPSWDTPGQRYSIVNNDDCNCGTGAADFIPSNFGLKSPGESGGFGAGRDLDHTNTAVRQGIKDWMNWLKGTIGFDGWRYDFVHGYHPKYIKEYNAATNPSFSVGEILEGDRQRISNWLDLTKDGSAEANSTAFDFATKSALQNAFNDNNLSYLKDGNGKPSGLIGWSPTKAVTMLDNHDTGAAPNQAVWVFPGAHIEKGYAYIMTHPGIPMVFWDHMFDYGVQTSNTIKTLIAIRKKNQIKNNSVVNIVNAQSNLYSAIIDNKVAMKLGSGSWSPSGTGWVVAASGTDWAVWEKTTAVVTNPTSTFTVYFKKPAGWASATKVYYWNTIPATAMPATTYPGVNMTADGQWFKFTFNNTSSTNLIFNDGGTTNKTIDLSRNKTGYFYNNQWYDNNPLATSTGFTVHLHKPTSWAGAKIYFWNTTPISCATSPVWPGANMVAETGGWFKYTFTNCSSANLVFNSGTGLQSADLTRNKEGWYKNGVWYDTLPSSTARFATEDETIIEDINDKSISIISNPVTNDILFTNEVSTASVYSYDGKLVLNVEKTDKIDVAKLQKGIYFVVFEDDLKNVYKEKVIKE
jgi:alpha-amylase